MPNPFGGPCHKLSPKGSSLLGPLHAEAQSKLVPTTISGGPLSGPPGRTHKVVLGGPMHAEAPPKQPVAPLLRKGAKGCVKPAPRPNPLVETQRIGLGGPPNVCPQFLGGQGMPWPPKNWGQVHVKCVSPRKAGGDVLGGLSEAPQMFAPKGRWGASERPPIAPLGRCAPVSPVGPRGPRRGPLARGPKGAMWNESPPTRGRGNVQGAPEGGPLRIPPQGGGMRNEPPRVPPWNKGET